MLRTFRKLGEVDRELGKPVDERDECIRVGRRSTAVTPDEPAGLAALHELVRVEIGQRRDAEVRAADQLCEDAARPERDERAEHRVLHDAGEQLDAAGEHRLHEQGPSDALGCSANLFVGAEVQCDAAALGLVCAGKGHLEHDRTPEEVRGSDCFVGVRDHLLRHERDAVDGQELPRR